MTTKEFWERLVSEGLISGDPTYYSSGKATEAEVAHAIETAMTADRTAFVNAAFDTGVAEGDRNYWMTTPAEGDASLITAVTKGSAGSASTPASTSTGGTGSAAFWKRLVSEGLISGDPAYYSSGKATPEEVAHAIEVAMSSDRKAFVNAAFDTGVAEGDRNYWMTTPAEGDASLITAVTKGSTGSQAGDAGGGVTTAPSTVDESPNKEGVGGKTEDTLSILTSQDMKWFFDVETGSWMVSYKLPNSNRSVVFHADGSQMDTIFGEGLRPTSFEKISFADLTQREGVTFAGNIAEVEGTGTFEGEVDRVIALALDEGILPKWAQGSGAVYDLLYISYMEDKSSEWLIEELAKLPEFKTRFPNLQALTATGLTITEAVTGFIEMEIGVKNIILRDGGNPDSVTPDTIGELLGQGHSLTDVTKTYETFDRLAKNQGAMDAFNEVLVAQGQSPLSASDQFEFMAGNSPKDLYDIWEQASLHQAAIDAGLDIGVDAAISLAARTEGLTSFATATAGLTQAAANMLRFRGELDFGRFGINEQDIIDLSLGLAPSSGISQADLGISMERAFSSAQATRERARVNPFKRFSDTGVPQAASLSGVRQESS